DLASSPRDDLAPIPPESPLSPAPARLPIRPHLLRICPPGDRPPRTPARILARHPAAVAMPSLLWRGPGSPEVDPSPAMDNKRYMLALALCMGVIILWTYFVLPPAKPPVPAGRQTSPVASSPGSTPAPPSEVVPVAPSDVKGEASSTPPGPAPKEEAQEESEKTVETPLYRIRLGNRGGRVLGWELKTHL